MSTQSIETLTVENRLGRLSFEVAVGSFSVSEESVQFDVIFSEYVAEMCRDMLWVTKDPCKVFRDTDEGVEIMVTSVECSNRYLSAICTRITAPTRKSESLELSENNC